MKSTPRTLITGAVIALTATALVSCTSPTDDTETTSITIGISGFNPNFDPLHGGSDLVSVGPQQAVFDSLLMWNRETRTAEPWLVSEYTASDDGRTITMTLRDDVDFVDGTHMDAAGVEAYLDVLFPTAEEFAADQEDGEVEVTPYEPLFTDFEPEFTATGEYTLEVTANKPMRERFLAFLGEIPILSPAIVDSPATAAEEPLGSGPYLVDKIVADVSASFVRNPDYWNAEAYDFDEVTFLVFVDNVAALNALKSGQIDATAIDIPLAAEAEESGLVLHTGVGRFPSLVFYDRTGATSAPIADVRVRQAINLAFDRETIAETLNLGYGEVSSQPFTEGEPEYVEGGDEYYGYDPDRARELLAEAGYPDGFDLTILSGGLSASPFIATSSFEPLIIQALGDIGIRVTFATFVDGAEWFGEVTSGKYAVIAFPHIYGNVVPFLIGGDGFLTPFEDPELAALKHTVDYGTAEESAEASQAIGRLLLEDAWFAPIAKAPAIWASDPEVTLEVGAKLRTFRLAD